jgi:hypothetical protein
MKKLLVVLSILVSSSCVQAQNIEGQIIASQYGRWKVPGYASNTYSAFAPTSCRVQGGASFFFAFTVGTPITIVDGNQTLTLNYMEGMSGPIHFSQYAGREVAMGAARKWSVDDIAGSVAVRCERQLPGNASPFGALRQSQVLIGSSAPDGTVQMIATGVYNDNGSGIACQYETTSGQDLMDVSMLGGVSINALGEGSMTVSVMVARSYVDSQQQLPGTSEIKLAPFPLTPENWRGYDGGGRGQNERFRMRFTNGTAADAWFALKYCSLYTRPLFTGRTSTA